MRFLPSLFDSRSFAALPPGNTRLVRGGELGRDGDSWLGMLAGGGPDVNSLLTGRLKHIAYDEMAKTSASVKSLLMFLALPIRSAGWGLNPREDSPVARAIADMVAWNLGLEDHEGELDYSFDELLQMLLKAPQFGAMFAELVWFEEAGSVVREWRDADGDSHLVRPLDRIAPRSPTSISGVRMDKGRVVELRQDLPDTKPIPGEKLVYVVFEREGDHWDGVSMLRPAWFPWYLQKNLLTSAGISWDRYAGGTPVVWHPDNDEGEAKGREIGRGLQHHERSYVHLPKPEGLPKEEADYWIELLDGARTIGDPTPLLQFCSEQIAEAGLQQFTKLGTTATGSRAVGDVQIDPFYLAVNALADYLRREISRQIIRPLVRMNFGQEALDRYAPILTVSRIHVRSIETMSKAISLLNDAGFMFTDREAQNDVRDLLGLPHVPDELTDHGIAPGQLLGVLHGLGLDQATFAKIVNALPPEFGLARNTVPGEGEGLLAA